MRTDARIGQWWAACCIEDLYRIDTADDVETIREWTNDEDGITIAGIWDTKAEAIEALGGLGGASAVTRIRLESPPG